MKISMSRQNIYLLVISIFLFVFVLVFSFGVLIPNGKEYRLKSVELRKANRELQRYEEFYDDTYTRLKDLQAKHRHIISAFDTSFSSERFIKQHKGYFQTLQLSKLKKASNEGEFDVYEVNTTSHIHSPKSFYDFLDALNKSDWIIGINFPIHFKRDAEMIRSTFTMKVFSAQKDSNTTK